MKARKAWIDANDPLPVAAQCALAGTNRTTFYVTPPSITLDAKELILLELIDKEYTIHSFYGSRKIKHYLCSLGYRINRKRVNRLMRNSHGSGPEHQQAAPAAQDLSVSIAGHEGYMPKGYS